MVSTYSTQAWGNQLSKFKNYHTVKTIPGKTLNTVKEVNKTGNTFPKSILVSTVILVTIT